MTDSQKHVIIVGGGLAGIACTVRLAEYHLRVTLVEARHSLGGRAGSFEDNEQPGELLDNCQHVLLGCCTNLLDLYRRLGAENKIAFHRTVHFLDQNGGRHNLWSIRGLPAPLHLGLSFALFSALTFKERIAVARGMTAALRLGRHGRQKLESTSFGDWLDAHRQPPSLIKKFYDPIVISALNEDTRRASAKYALSVFQDAMLAHRRGYVIGLPACPLGELYQRVPGVNLTLNTRVEEITFATRDNLLHATGVRLRGATEDLPADAVVLATNHHAVSRWIPPELKPRDPRFAGLDQLESVPILGAHLWFDRPIMPHMPAAALIDGPLQWLFRKDTEGRALHGVISAAREWPNIPKDDALRQFEAQIHRLFDPTGQAKLLRGIIIIEKRATFAPLPGTDALRPAQAPPQNGIQNLFLAGDYTQTNWPATMEGAVRSGYLAAQSLLASLALPETLTLPDLPIEWPARLMGLAR